MSDIDLSQDASKPRRPLPTPTMAPNRPNTPVSIRSDTPPPLPTRPKVHGSSHTAFMTVPSSQPPTYDPEYREPELISDTVTPEGEYNPYTASWGNPSGPTPYGWGTEGTWYSNQDPWAPTISVAVGGRSTEREINWWNPEATKDSNGPGMLPPLVANELHNPEHTLYKVSPEHASIPSHSKPTVAVPSGTSSPPQASSSTSSSAPYPPPQLDEIKQALPHPDAFYSPKENGWIILHSGLSFSRPVLARSYDSLSRPQPLDGTHNMRDCLDDKDQKVNRTHHFHKYEKAFDPADLEPPYRADEWETIETVKSKRRVAVINTEQDLDKMKANDHTDTLDGEEGMLMDLYTCCQCSRYIVVSPVIPAVLPQADWREFLADKHGNPQLNKTPEFTVAQAVSTLIVSIENMLFKGERRMLRVQRPGFLNKMGWNPLIQRLYSSLGFDKEILDHEDALRPPSTDPNTAQGVQTRARLLRAWLELSAWHTEYIRKCSPAALKELKPPTHVMPIQNIREEYQKTIGAHPDHIPRNLFDANVAAVLAGDDLRQDLQNLGLTPSICSGPVVAFAYYAQCRCDPANTMFYYSSLAKLEENWRLYSDSNAAPSELQETLHLESSRDRFTWGQLQEAAQLLGFGVENSLGVELKDAKDDFVEQAWRYALSQAWNTGVQEKAKEVHNALKIVAESRKSVYLRELYDKEKDRPSLEQAYERLGIGKETEDGMILTVYNIRAMDAPHALTDLQTSLTVINEHRNSERLKVFLATGQDPGDIVAPTRPDWPRGLNQLGNTCYLNSLLQYFYTIKDLRDAVVAMANLDLKTVDEAKLTDDELKRHRVGGRLVTRREIVRSKKFVQQLAELFSQMEFSDVPSITPSLELAKLALVTSKDEEDEEEAEAEKGGTDTSNDTDATLVEDGHTRYPTVEPNPLSSHPSSSSLGKRDRGGPWLGSSNGGQSNTVDADGDVPMEDNTVGTKRPPPLPPRKKTELSGTVMMFGKQHDVAECMDNIMFQIETALLKFSSEPDQVDAGSSDKTSVVKRLFYGKTLQKLGHADPMKLRTPAEPKIELFAHLHLNVAEDGFDIYDGLGRYFDDIVDYEDRKVPRQLSLVTLPPLLQIQLQRVQFDRDTLQSWKSQAYVKFGETIYMDRFLNEADPEKRTKSKSIQEELNKSRERIKELTRGKDGPIISILETTENILKHHSENIDIPEIDQHVLFSSLSEEQELVQKEVSDLRVSIAELKEELEELWKDEQSIAYELSSVFIHRGTSPSWGHYFFYSRHLPEAPDDWFKYNDSEVTAISKEDVLRDTTGSSENPYLLVFARKGSEVVDTVKRFEEMPVLVP